MRRISIQLFASATILQLAFATAALGQAAVTIQKFTNGQHVTSAPGPIVIVGSTVNWTYVVTNASGRGLSNISVVDDQGVTVTCPSTTLDAGASMTCTASGTAVTGQYQNIGTVNAEEPDTTQVSASDTSYYYGQAAAEVSLQKSTEGQDADTPPGPSLPVGSTVNWTYVVTNLSTTDTLSNITVTDDHGVSVSCPATSLAPSASITCTGSGTVQVGQYSNIGTVTAFLPSESETAASDPSHYYGQTLVLQKSTNGDDADFPPGPTVTPGSIVNWTYVVTNPGPATVTGLTVTDDQSVTVSCPQTTLAAGESVTCTASGIAQTGQYANVGTATATLPLGGTVTATDASHYFGNPIAIEKHTNGVDADTVPGPSVAVGSPVNWTYTVTNNAPDTVTGVTVTDDQGVTVTCPGATLASGASMTCTASGTAVAGQYSNVGTVDATSATLGALSASDPSHYYGETKQLDFGDAPDPTYNTLFASDGARHVLGSGVYLGACVDAEADGLPNATATGDDNSVGTAFGTCAVPGDDDDGVTFTSPIVPGIPATVDVVASAPCTLSAWIDFDANGNWSGTGEDLFPGGVALTAGTNSLGFSVPATATVGQTFARFRCTTDGAVSWTGEASDGEVEDYEVTTEAPTITVAATKTATIANDVNSDGQLEEGDTLLYTIVITNTGNVDATGVVFNDTPDALTTLVSGSVTTTAGTVTTGNAGGDTSVSVDVGTLARSGGTATITFEVTIGQIIRGITSISNQGSVSGSNFPTVLTDDPAVGGAADPTVTAVTVLLPAPVPAVGILALLAMFAMLSFFAIRGIKG